MRWMLFSLMLFAVNGCTRITEIGPGCLPNEVKECKCLDGRDGNQVCNSSGNAYTPCICVDAPTPDASSGGDDDSGDTSGDATDGADVPPPDTTDTTTGDEPDTDGGETHTSGDATVDDATVGDATVGDAMDVDDDVAMEDDAGTTDGDDSMNGSCVAGSSVCQGGGIAICIDGASYADPVPCGSQKACEENPELMLATCVALLCEPDAVFCGDNMVQTCASDGLTIANSMGCGDLFCVAGSCQDVACMPNSGVCNGTGTAVTVCDVTGQTETTLACPMDTRCVTGICRPIVCRAGNNFCLDEQPHACDQTATLATPMTPCGVDQVCVAGSCQISSCTPGKFVCNGLLQRQVCNNNGNDWVTGDCPEGQSCKAGTCFQRECSPSARFCDDNGVVQECDADGLTTSGVTDCPGKDTFCLHGECLVAGCSIGAAYCDGSSVKVCDGTGIKGSTTDQCGSGEGCTQSFGAAQCTILTCKPGQSSCNGAVATTCNAVGSGYLQGGTDCGLDGMSCTAGACAPSVCGDGIPEAAEGCDDGDADNWDGCSNACQLNPTWVPLLPDFGVSGFADAFACSPTRGMAFGIQEPFDGVKDTKETWTLAQEGGSWTWSSMIFDPTPDGRGRAGAFYDSSTGDLMLFGGDDGTQKLNDTWAFSGTLWSAKNISGPPTPRSYYGMAFDPAGGKGVLFGGAIASGLIADTWVWGQNTWMSKFVIKAPPARAGHSAEWDPVRGYAVLFGGVNAADTVLNDTWKWDGDKWTEITPAGPGQSPSPRHGHAMAWNDALSMVVVYGGSGVPDGTGGFLSDTWAWDGFAWNLLSTPAGPGPRWRAGACHLAMADGTILTGGADEAGPVAASTWLLKVPECAPGALLCANGDVYSCDAIGETVTLVQQCGASAFCVATGDTAACLQQVCDPSKVFCAGAQLVKCDSAGKGTSLIEDCAPDKFCSDNQCTEQPSSGGQVFIAGGTFWMGCNALSDENCAPDESPQHEVTLNSFFVDRHEVTVEEYTQCVSDGLCTKPPITSGEDPAYNYNHPFKSDHPVNGVTWAQADAYCAAEGKRLPTAAEWEKAARGGCELFAGQQCAAAMPSYPWGNAVPNCDLANFEDGCTTNSTAVPGDRPAGNSPYTVSDMAGNVAEWVNDLYDATYYATSPAENPPGGAGPNHEIRGGGYDHGVIAVGSSRRSAAAPETAAHNVGFRCAKSF